MRKITGNLLHITRLCCVSLALIANSVLANPLNPNGQTGLWYGEVPGNLNFESPNPKTEVINNPSIYTEDKIKESTTEIYSGQIFDEDGVISFTENIDDKAYIKLNGQVVLNDDRWYVRTNTGKLVVNPGWNDIEIRISNGNGSSGPRDGVGIGFDPTGGTTWQTLDPNILRPNVGTEGQNLTDFYLIDADSNTVLAQLTEGQQLDLADLPSSYAFSYNPVIDADGTVVVALAGAVTATRSESVKPYTLFGDSNNDYFGNPSDKKLVEGSYQLTANDQSVNFIITTGGGDTGGGDTGGGDTGGGDTGGGDTGGGDTGEKIILQTSQLSHSTGQGLSNAIDESISSRWTSSQAQTPGQYFQIDLFQPTVLTKIVMQTSDGSASVNDYPRGYDVLLSNDGREWDAHITGGVGNQSGETNIPMNGKTARYVRIVQTGSSSFWWSIHNIDVFAVDYNNNNGGDNGEWNLVWGDEFDTNTIDSTKWDFETNCWGGGNSEQQCYTDRPENAFVSQGLLNIVARREDFTGINSADGVSGGTVTLPYTSARLRTKNKQEWTFGRFEIRAKLPFGQGTWPAIWMLPTDSPYGGWASSGEIDIMEAVNLKVDGEARVHGTLHYGRAWPDNVHSGTEYLLPNNQNPADDFHTYAIEWEAGEIRWYVDGVHYATQREEGWYSQYQDGETLVDAPVGAPFDAEQSFHLLLNLAVGGNWSANVNQGGIDESVFPQTLQVDWVRVYECSVDPATGKGCASFDSNAQVVSGYTRPELPGGGDTGGGDTGGGDTGGGDTGGGDTGGGDTGGGDTGSGGTGSGGTGSGGTGNVSALYDQTTELEPAIVTETNDALITRFSDRARDRHAKENHYSAYDHYLTFYWEQRTAAIEIIDYVAKGGDTIIINVRPEQFLSALEARTFYIGKNTLAEFCGNGGLVQQGNAMNYTKIITGNCREGGPLQIGDKMEFEISQFLTTVDNGRTNYYGTTYLYIVGEGLVPWDTYQSGPYQSGVELVDGVRQRDSKKIPESAWLGGMTTIHAEETHEPDNHFMQFATNLGYENGQAFVLGRRLVHTSFIDGQHDENAENGVFAEMAGLGGNRYTNARCNDCHERNGAAAPEPVGQNLDRWVFKLGDGNDMPDPQRGSVLQPKAVNGTGEGDVSIQSWTEQNGLRSPNFQFSTGTPAQFTGVIAPRLVGMGLIEAIPEESILSLQDENDSNGDGISGKANLIVDADSGKTLLGRYGWKASQPTLKHQVASALNKDMGVMTSMMPNPDCGSEQANCGNSGTELSDEHLDNLVKYIALLGVRPQRDYDDPDVIAGENTFNNIGCASCHTPSFQTSEFHPFAELRNQTIRPYSDFLLHDMGPGLASTLGDGVATQSEWRTAPLWGLGLSACVTGGVTGDKGDAAAGTDSHEECVPKHSYLHDGRARSIEEAILWHGGEGENAKSAYQALPSGQKQQLLDFLNSL